VSNKVGNSLGGRKHKDRKDYFFWRWVMGIFPNSVLYEFKDLFEVNTVH